MRLDRMLKSGPKQEEGFWGGVTGLRIIVIDMVFEVKLLEDENNFPRVGALAAIDSELFSVICRHFFRLWGC